MNDVIASVGAQGIVNACYAQNSLNNVFCSQFERFRGPGTGPTGEVPGDILGNSLINAPLNYASRIRRGIDTQISYRTNITDDVRVSTNLIYTHNLQISNFQNALDPTFEDRILSELGDPQDEFRWDVDLTVGAFTLGYRMHYIGPMFTTTYESVRELAGACGTTSCPPLNADTVNIEQYQEVFYHDLRLTWDIRGGDSILGRIIPAGSNTGLRFFVGVDNVLDTAPPLGLTATGAGSAIYDLRGRTYYAGFRARF